MMTDRVSKWFMGLALVLGLIFASIMLGGCSTTQCQVARRTFATAQIGHDAAMLAGHTTQIDRYWWAMGAASAMVEFWCAAGVEGEVVP